MVTLKEIARQCGVSVASVSKALNAMPGVSARTAERIRHAAREMEYIPNAAAQALKSSRSFTIGVLLEDDEHHGLLHQFFVRLLESFKVAMEAQGFDLTLMNRTIGRRHVSYLEHCRYSNLDGVLAACVDFADPQVVELASSAYPLVSIDHAYPGHPSVMSDNAAGTRLAVRYAYEMGHRRIAYVTGADSGVTRKRLEGYNAAMESLGLPVPPGYVAQSHYRDVALTREKASELLQMPDPPTCILLPDDYAALGGLLAAGDVGLGVPEGVSLIGFDGLDMFEHMIPRLTTVRQDAESMGRAAAALLLERIEGDAGARARSVSVPVSLIHGGTVAPPK